MIKMTFCYYFDMYVVYVSIRYGLKFFFEDFILYLLVINVHCSLMFSLEKKKENQTTLEKVKKNLFDVIQCPMPVVVTG